MALPLMARPRRALRRPEASPNKHQDRVNFHNDKAFEPLPEDHPEANAVDINLAAEDDSFGESLAGLRPSLANKGPALVRRAFFDQVSPLSQAADLIPGFGEKAIHWDTARNWWSCRGTAPRVRIAGPMLSSGLVSNLSYAARRPETGLRAVAAP